LCIDAADGPRAIDAVTAATGSAPLTFVLQHKETTMTSDHDLRHALHVELARKLEAMNRKHPEEPHAARGTAIVATAISMSPKQLGAIEAALGLGTRTLADFVSAKKDRIMPSSVLFTIIGDPMVLGDERIHAWMISQLSTMMMDSLGEEPLGSPAFELLGAVDSIGAVGATIERAMNAQSDGGERIVESEARAISACVMVATGELDDVSRSSLREAGVA
jgi:hypothetical protein